VKTWCVIRRYSHSETGDGIEPWEKWATLYCREGERARCSFINGHKTCFLSGSSLDLQTVMAVHFRHAGCLATRQEWWSSPSSPFLLFVPRISVGLVVGVSPSAIPCMVVDAPHADESLLPAVTRCSMDRVPWALWQGLLLVVSSRRLSLVFPASVILHPASVFYIEFVVAVLSKVAGAPAAPACKVSAASLFLWEEGDGRGLGPPDFPGRRFPDSGERSGGCVGYL
jgi:hypothetical protein